MSKTAIALFAVGTTCMLVCTGCRSTYEMSGVSGARHFIDARYDAVIPESARQALAVYKDSVDGIMSPVIGHSANYMTSDRPEGALSNLVADVIAEAAVDYLGKKVDVAVMNVGGLRTVLPVGPITVGRIYQITPFENSLCVVSMTGEQLQRLFADIAHVYGMGLSGAAIEIDKQGRLLKATVDGQPIDESRTYTVATVEYLAEGNDGLVTFKESKVITQPEGCTLRGLFMDYVKRAEQRGEPLRTPAMGRVVIREWNGEKPNN